VSESKELVLSLTYSVAASKTDLISSEPLAIVVVVFADGVAVRIHLNDLSAYHNRIAHKYAIQHMSYMLRCCGLDQNSKGKKTTTKNKQTKLPICLRTYLE
jgi:hypothetical protein